MQQVLISTLSTASKIPFQRMTSEAYQYRARVIQKNCDNEKGLHLVISCFRPPLKKLTILLGEVSLVKNSP